MKKTLQECKEIVAKERDVIHKHFWNEELTDLANKMYYEQSENEILKAENLKQFLLKKYPTKDYFDCPVPKHHWKTIQEYAEHYARIQIEKDRERVENTSYVYFSGEVTAYQLHQDTPIILD